MNLLSGAQIWCPLSVLERVRTRIIEVFLKKICENFLGTLEIAHVRNRVACVASVSVRFRSKEQGTRAKNRAKNGATKTENPVLGLRNQTETLATQASNREVFLPRGSTVI